MFKNKLRSVLKVSAVVGALLGIFYCGGAFADGPSGSIVQISDVQTNLTSAYASVIQILAGAGTVGGTALLIFAVYHFRQNYIKSQQGQSTLINAMLCALAGISLLGLSYIGPMISAAPLGSTAGQNFEKTSGKNFETLVKSS